MTEGKEHLRWSGVSSKSIADSFMKKSFWSSILLRRILSSLPLLMDSDLASSIISRSHPLVFFLVLLFSSKHGVSLMIAKFWVGYFFSMSISQRVISANRPSVSVSWFFTCTSRGIWLPLDVIESSSTSSSGIPCSSSASSREQRVLENRSLRTSLVKKRGLFSGQICTSGS